MVIISQYVHVSNDHVHLKLLQFYMSVITKAEKNLERKRKY